MSVMLTDATCAPLVRVVEGELTAMPEPGHYYARDGRMLLCVDVRGEYVWFVDADNTPLVIISAAELARAPLVAVRLERAV